ncbi:septum formation inhibitor Maf [Pusillimonas sp. CC-YST705]|uniref:dTTP/UTP pyrophosphatase n=1 Tax=Mesopusillimonas faecipullorum TaxID=2755040 RepID=A0ABS8C9X9_9BURK|nr:nucleoside triphosphate pyrophosphatase [Mesopusillimonas faecipullorum]MCB5362849.1 septum formation inhibitor Maf [Mesopusillimonas faecipullorum]
MGTSISHPNKLWLASASPRRRELLDQMQVRHEVLRVPSPPGEDEPRLAGESPIDYVCRTAYDKAQRARQWLETHEAQSSGQPILAADTTVALGDEIFGKPNDAEQAALFLRRLSGTTHQVLSAVVIDVGAKRLHALSISEVSFAHLKDEEIVDYCRTGEPMGKAGAYAIQGRAALFVSHIAGSHSGIMGLPIRETYALIEQAGLSTLMPWRAS